jgi:predicted NBD/HSP70 family sugar kinase
MARVEFDELMSIGIDIGKDTFHLVGFDREGQRVIRQQIKRLALIAPLRSFLDVLLEWKHV